MKNTLKLAVALAVALPVAAFAGTGDALSLVPKDAVTVGVVRLADLRSSALAATLLQHTDDVTTDGDADRFLSDAGLQPAKDVDVLVVATSPRTPLGSEAEVLVLAEGRFTVDRLTRALTSRGAVRNQTPNGVYYTLPEGSRENHQKGAVSFPSASLAILGTEAAVVEALGARASGGTTFTTASNLGLELKRIDSRATAWAIVDVTRAQRLAGSPSIPNKSGRNAALAAAVKNVSTVALWAVDAGDSLRLGATGLSADTETLGLVEDTLRGALSAMRLAVQEKQPDLVPVLRRFAVERSGNSVTITGSIPADTLRQLSAKKQAAK